MSDEPTPTIDQQITEIEAVYLSREAQLRQRAAAIAAGKSVPPDIGCISSSMPTLGAALKTLRWVRENQDALRSIAASKILAADEGKRA